MLAAANRIRRGADFTSVVRRGRRAGRPRMVVHALLPEEAESVQAGFIVSRAVGNSVVRHRVQRRLRHLVRQRLEVFAGPCLLVIRARPAAASSSSRDLARDLDAACARLQLYGCSP